PAAGRGRSIRSMLGGLLPGRKAPEKHTPPDLEPEDETPVEAAPPVSLEAPLDPKFANRPLEPGSGAPDLNAIMRRVRDERGQSAGSGDADAAKSDFIAAARRAAQAAAAEAEVLKRKSDIGGPVKALRIADVLKSRRKQILMVGTGIAIALGGLQLGKVLMNDPVETAANGAPPVVVARLNAASPGDVSAPPASEGIADEETVVAAPVAGGGQSEEFAVRGMAAQAGLPNAALEQASATHSAASGTIEVAASVQPAAASAQPPAPLEVPVEAGPPALRRAAGSGDPRALFEVASRFAEGRGARQDLAEAAKWYQKAAELGLAPAQFRIGNFYEKGLGVARDIDRSKSWYHRAAEHGNASAMHNLAVLYAMGVDGTADNEKAARWFVSAAELGVKDSQFNLGVLAAKGVGMPQDLAESYKWFAVLAMSGDSDAAGKRDEIARALSPEKLATARVAAEQWKPKPLDAVANAVDVPDEWQDGKDETAVDMDEAIGNVRVTLDDNRL
ncbi:MAG: peptidoglycan-binding protein, partial [Rhizobiaceae bacterium]|nr:peptidoglycan-binding protein [Rhizobiaceae bacterium]